MLQQADPSARPPVLVFWNTRQWADAIAALPSPGPLPCRTVLVDRERVAHALRREIVRRGHKAALAGTRFVPLAVAAIEVLQAAGIAVTPQEDGLRRARVAALLEAGVPLAHFPIDLVRTQLGWDEAFAAAIGDLEAAGLTPEDLDARDAGDHRLRDVAVLWRALDAAAGPSWTIQRIVARAAALLEEDPGRWPYPGPVLAAGSGDATLAEARFIRAVPNATLGLLAARPVRSHYVERVRGLFGVAAADALTSATAPRSAESERAILASFLFEPPEVLADPARPRSSGPDATADIEQHAGVEDALEATADWVSRQILQGTPLEEIAVLMPALDPLAALVVERLARLPWPDGSLPVFVAGGRRVVETAAGARALAAIRALRAHLGGEALAGVLPSLRTVPEGARHLSHGAATDLLWALGTVGGSPAHPEGALEWAARAGRREHQLAEQLARAREAADDPEQSGLAREARDLERLLRDLRAIRPALEALTDVARHVVAKAPLSTLWPCLRQFFEEWLLQPGPGARVQVLLDDALAGAIADPMAGAVAGEDALRMIEATLAGTRVADTRFGEPAVYIGTVADAAGLPFRAVRVIGLAEGHLPPLPREDPIIPDAVRAALTVPGADGHRIGPPVAADRSLAPLHALDKVVRNAESHIALSAPRLGLERSLREPASVVLEAAAALGRPDSTTGRPGAAIPDGAALERDAFRPARARALELRHGSPIGEPAWQDCVAARVCGVPPRWSATAALDLARMAALRRADPPGPLDGILAPTAAVLTMPGLASERPISPSKLRDLLQCPHRFMLGALLGFGEPATAPERREIGQPSYGALLHSMAQQFYEAHGASFCARHGDLDLWRSHADAVVERVFDEFLEQYPLAGAVVRDKERERIRRDFHDWLAYDWYVGSRFLAVERAFGRPDPLALAAGGRSLYVRGQIDRLDVDGHCTLVRDLKTGRPRPRRPDDEPDPVLDVQIAVYALAARRMAAEWKVPARVAAAYVYVSKGVQERAWRDDFDSALAPAAEEWLATAADLLHARAFPRTPDPNDCTYCSFRPLCGDAAQRAGEHLARAEGVLARFARVRGVEAAS